MSPEAKKFNYGTALIVSAGNRSTRLRVHGNTYYVGGLIDLVMSGSTTNYRHYIYAGSEPIAVYSRTAAGVNTMSYMIEDHQGGISNIASKSGASDVNESFSAFGTRRNPTSWSGAPTTADLNTIAGLSRQGYTFQTWLGQSMGLNHMNGRVQDAILGRFLSADPHIPDPSNAQSYNRYTYVNNNPLTFVDPTGFACGLHLRQLQIRGRPATLITPQSPKLWWKGLVLGHHRLLCRPPYLNLLSPRTCRLRHPWQFNFRLKVRRKVSQFLHHSFSDNPANRLQDSLRTITPLLGCRPHLPE